MASKLLLIKCQVHKCLDSRHVNYGLYLVTTLLCCLFVKAEGGFVLGGFRPRELLSWGFYQGGSCQGAYVPHPSKRMNIPLQFL